MAPLHPGETAFIKRVTEVIEKHISSEQFGVSELADEIGMSRSNLLRKIKKLTNESVSQFIRRIRMEHAMVILKEGLSTVSEVSYQIGFNSVSYFIKCFGDHYGYPPGEVGKHDEPIGDAPPIEQTTSLDPPTQKKRPVILTSSLLLLVLIIAPILIFKPFSSKPRDLEKSIAVLPFINDSNDSTNIHIINGLMESLLTNLQNIEDLRVISRTSVEKFRNHTKTIPEIAKALDVSYFVEGSGQKLGDKILLHIQLIEAKTDKHLWAENYKRDSKDIFGLQQEIANDIAKKVQAIITPEEQDRIEKVPTSDLVAYDYFLKGQDLMFKGGPANLVEAVEYFEKAIKQDGEFAHAYADLSITYFLIDANQTIKKYAVQINEYADKALLIDPKLAQSLIAKALYFLNNSDYQEAISYLEKALEYNPNSATVINTLADIYNKYLPDTERYLEYAIKGARLDIAAQDSLTASFTCLHISNAFIQTGFIDQALTYIDKSLSYFPGNLYSEYVKAYIQFASNSDLNVLINKLLSTFQKDTTRLDIAQEVGKIYYYLRDFENSYRYYNSYLVSKKSLNLDIFPAENAKIGVVLAEMGLAEESENCFQEYWNYANGDQSIYRNLSLAVYYSWHNDAQKAIEHLKLFAEEDHYHYWTILFINMDPLIDPIKDHPEFKRLMKDIEEKFWLNHGKIKASLGEKRLL